MIKLVTGETELSCTERFANNCRNCSERHLCRRRKSLPKVGILYLVWVEFINYFRKLNGRSKTMFNIMFKKKKEINSIRDIRTQITEGSLLLMAIAIISTESQLDKTPDEIIKKIKELYRKTQEKIIELDKND